MVGKKNINIPFILNDRSHVRFLKEKAKKIYFTFQKKSKNYMDVTFFSISNNKIDWKLIGFAFLF